MSTNCIACFDKNFINANYPIKCLSGENICQWNYGVEKGGGGCTALKSIRVIAYGTCCFLCCVVWYVLVLRFLECGVLLVQIKSFFCAGITYRCRISLCVLKGSLLKHPAASIGYIWSIYQCLSGSCADFCLWLLSYSMREADLFLRVPLVHV